VLEKYPPALQMRALRRMAAEFGSGPSRDVSLALQDLLRGQPGRRVTLGSGLEAEFSSERLWMYRVRPPSGPIPVSIPGETSLPDGSRLVVTRACAAPPFPDGLRRARIAAAADGGRWEMRPAEAGDRMQPFGMNGSRLVMDLLAESGVPRHARSRAWVLAKGERIYWLLGVRLAEIARVGPHDEDVHEFSWCAETI
jgi:tRNA(Ile)-lysidine synthase